jgi:ferrochelatase
MKAKKRILVFSPAFVADCLETTIEIGEEYLELFKEHGGEKIQLVPSLNDNDDWAQGLYEIIKEKVKTI